MNSSGDHMPSTERKETLADIIARNRLSKMAGFGIIDAIVDDYKVAEESRELVASHTGVAFDDIMAKHKCEWDKRYPENPERYYSIMQRLTELQLLRRGRCVRISGDRKIVHDIGAVHADPLGLLNKLCADLPQNQKLHAANYDAIYFNNYTAEAAVTALSLTNGVVRAVALSNVQNGLAVVRPPGHHAMAAEFCGYCYVNNVAVTARSILDDKAVEVRKILIFDFDVHHGQATQQMFYDTDEVLYISIHRYEHGTFWPNLRQSNYDFIGKPGSPGFGYNVNIPLNVTGCGDAEYMAILTNIVLPMAYEFQPDLVIFSAGYDACIGCPEGEMRVTPAFYGHMVKLLSGFANGKLAVILEGGYYLPSLAEGVALTLKALYNDPTGFLEPLGAPLPSVVDTINNVMGVLAPLWACFAHRARPPTESEPAHRMLLLHQQAAGEPPFAVEDCYPVQSRAKLEEFAGIMAELQDRTALLEELPVGYTYDNVMLDHRPENNSHPERPDRLSAVYELFKRFDLNVRCQFVQHKPATFDQLLLAHDSKYASRLVRFPLEVEEICGPSSRRGGDGANAAGHDVYVSRGTWNAAANAAGCVLHLAKRVMKGDIGSGVALVRPPGHHAEHDLAAGFCVINNVAVAAKWIRKNYPTERILIVDFDIHHGNGTQHAFYEDNQVLFISMHKFEGGQFYPGLPDGGANYIGGGNAKGFNVNIPFNNGKLGDADYVAVFHSIVLPIAYSFAPTVVLVSAGFDAGVHDRLGNYSVTPQAFGHFVHMLRPLARGRLILTMEGGYNICTLKYGMVMCTKALLGDALPPLQFAPVCPAAKQAIQDVINVQREYWPVLDVVRPLASNVAFLRLYNGVNRFETYDPGENLLNLCDWNVLMYPREFEKVPTYQGYK